jgi:type II secretory pathway pseudopilin PulG
MFRRLFKNEKGASLIEVLIGMLILGMIAATFIGGMNTVLTTSFRNSRQVHALALAQSQLEYIKQQDYNDDDIDSNPDNMGKYLTIVKPPDTPANFEIYGWDNSIDKFAKFWDVALTVEPKDLPTEDFPQSDTGIQVIKIVIKNNNNEVVELYGYKAER